MAGCHKAVCKKMEFKKTFTEKQTLLTLTNAAPCEIAPVTFHHNHTD